MRLKAQRTVIYVAMGLTMAALVGGYAAADLQMGSTNSQQQGTHSTTFAPVTGVNWVSTGLQELLGSVTSTAGCASAAGCEVTSSSATFCSGGVAGSTTCAAGDWVENVTLNTVADTPFSGTVEFTLYVTVNGVTYASSPSNYTDAAGNSLESINLLFGIGTPAPGNVTAVTVVGIEPAP